MVALCIDVGNSLTKIAVFKGDKLVFSQTLSSITEAYVRKLMKKFAIDAVMVCQVKSLKLSIKKILKKVAYYELTAKLELPLKLKYLTPDTLGKDRLAAACAANRLYSMQHLLVIGIGTAVTYDLVSSKGYFMGGSISPGLEMRLKALHTFTARLPKIEKNLQAPLTGTSTTEALQSGAIWGLQAEIQGMIDLYATRYHDLKVILFGGGADFFKKRLRKPIFAHPNLVLLGLKHILTLNAH